MICSTCKELGLKSKVYPGGDTTTEIPYLPYYDEEGDYHIHDPNITTVEYSCSNGHKWTEKESYLCPCGWGKDILKGQE